MIWEGSTWYRSEVQYNVTIVPGTYSSRGGKGIEKGEYIIKVGTAVHAAGQLEDISPCGQPIGGHQSMRPANRRTAVQAASQ